MLFPLRLDAQPDTVDGRVGRMERHHGATGVACHREVDPSRLPGSSRKGNVRAGHDGVGQWCALEDVILDLEISAIHIDAGIPLSDIKTGCTGTMAQDEPAVENEIEAVGCRL